MSALALLTTDSNCFAEALYAPPPVTSSYNTTVDVVSVDFFTTSYTDGTSTTEEQTSNTFLSVRSELSYVPTFQYGYQCSASLLQAYGPVFLLMALFSCLGEPMLFLLVRLLVDKGGTRFSRLRRLLPRALLLPEERTHLERGDYRVFDAHKLFMVVLQDLLVLLTFGIAAPLLGLAVTVSLFLKTLLWHHVLTHCSGGSSQAAEDVEADCAEFVSQPNPLFTARWFFVGFSSCFLSFFLVDAAGDAVGWKKAMWAPALMWTLPTMLALALGRFFSARAPSSQPTEAAATVELPPPLGKRASVSLEGIHGGEEGGDKEEDQRFTMSEVLERESGGHVDHIPAPSLRLSGGTASPLHASPNPSPTTHRLPV